MIKLILFSILILYAGFAVAWLWGKDHFNFFERIGIGFGIGLGLNSLFIFLLSWAGLTISSLSIILPLIIAGILISIKLYQENVFRLEGIKQKLTNFKLTKETVLSGSLLIFMFPFVLSTFNRALTSSFNYWDEFSFWGLASKIIFLNRSIQLKGIISTMEKYPLFIPINVASINIMMGSFYDNISRLIVPFSLIFVMIFMYGFLKRLELKNWEKLFFCALLLVSGPVIASMASQLYADIPFAYFYTIAVLIYLINIFQKSDKIYYLFSGIFFGLAAWTKLEGLQVSVMTIATLVFVQYLYSKKLPLSELKYLATTFLIFPALWAIYKWAYALDGGVSQQKLFAYTGFALQNVDKIIKGMISQMRWGEYWAYFWKIIAGIIALSALFFRKNKALITLILILLINIGYLFAVYLFFFSPRELLKAASFNRYLTHIVPLVTIMIAFFYVELKKFALKFDNTK